MIELFHFIFCFGDEVNNKQRTEFDFNKLNKMNRHYEKRRSRSPSSSTNSNSRGNRIGKLKDEPE